MITTNLTAVVKQLRTFFARKERQIYKLAELTPKQVGLLVKNEVVESIRREGLVASGDLLNSVTVSGLVGSTQLHSATVGSSSPYAKFVEEGVRAGGKMPPVDAIYRWMVNKGMQPSESGAYLVARKIQERGLPARKPFEKGVRNAQGKINGELQIILNKTLTKN